ncbi:hypothetical protein C8J57DRAFT_1724111 [Mycena rebaudengoi]|nr:hypothetical protein C8J57DRAFT_1724111 [Mycena rebaudengoi]
MTAIVGVIDPALMLLSRGSETTNGVDTGNGPLQTPPTNAAHVDTVPNNASTLVPKRDSSGGISETRGEYEARLQRITRKAPLVDACHAASIHVSSKSALAYMRSALVNQWFSSSPASASASTSVTQQAGTASSLNVPQRRPAPVRQRIAEPHDVLASVLNPREAEPITVPAPYGSHQLVPSAPHRGELSGGVPLRVSSTSHQRAPRPRASSSCAADVPILPRRPAASTAPFDSTM